MFKFKFFLDMFLYFIDGFMILNFLVFNTKLTFWCSILFIFFTFVNAEEEKHANNSGGYSKEFQAMLDTYDQEDCGEEISVKKRRLSSHQVKTLEISFEVENKLEPERKVKLAEELGLEPRQVAIWFQNRRARWKTKQLERDYNVLKADYDALKHNYDSLERQNKALAEKVMHLWNTILIIA